ncbi:predicted protein [Sclerotinia sclerotiorum 1980 UF-70]|uniref:Uncharacterized protein n=1 Tax=Sclerotinia sclerotiorum (strain ATCC 18683 / 1980 / Ss-1) TaxID=665079 RepID=A7ETT2_SCLS1|nr:predicted protein [Sclerotinia sclerotiorum 1980 UF-70]EDN92874.1 predicted protein [Sclerotinia sclerotiorum 1980 UF-70]
MAEGRFISFHKWYSMDAEQKPNTVHSSESIYLTGCLNCLWSTITSDRHQTEFMVQSYHRFKAAKEYTSAVKSFYSVIFVVYRCIRDKKSRDQHEYLVIRWNNGLLIHT